MSLFKPKFLLCFVYPNIKIRVYFLGVGNCKGRNLVWGELGFAGGGGCGRGTKDIT